MMAQWPHFMCTGTCSTEGSYISEGLRHTASVEDEAVLSWSPSEQLYFTFEKPLKTLIPN